MLFKWCLAIHWFWQCFYWHRGFPSFLLCERKLQIAISCHLQFPFAWESTHSFLKNESKCTNNIFPCFVRGYGPTVSIIAIPFEFHRQCFRVWFVISLTWSNIWSCAPQIKTSQIFSATRRLPRQYREKILSSPRKVLLVLRCMPKKLSITKFAQFRLLDFSFVETFDFSQYSLHTNLVSFIYLLIPLFIYYH